MGKMSSVTNTPPSNGLSSGPLHERKVYMVLYMCVCMYVCIYRDGGREGGRYIGGGREGG